MRHRVNSGQGINPTVTERVIRDLSIRYAVAGLRWIDRDIRISCVLQDRLGSGDVALQLWARRPEQGNHADHVWTGHRGPRKVAVASVAGTSGRANVHPGPRNIWLEQIRRIEGAGAAATKASKGVANVIGPSGEGRLVDRRWIVDGGAGRAGVSCGYLDEDACRLCVIHNCLQLGERGTALADWATPTIVHHVRPQCRVGILSVQVCRGDEKLEAFGISGRSAVALVHIAATDPLRTRGHSNLVTSSVVASGGAGCVRAVPTVITGLLVVGAARSAPGVDRIPPVVIVIGVNPVPATVMRFQRIVRPAHAGILIAHYDALPRKAHCPDLRRIHILHAPLDHRGSAGRDAKVRN